MKYRPNTHRMFCTVRDMIDSYQFWRIHFRLIDRPINMGK